ncbi:hypothetical protein DRN97_09710 [Methanosarcinales archaeon]|nr:MAG: hypothetical protein DRN97_09710 [Methanosarcinales archaeon]
MFKHREEIERGTFKLNEEEKNAYLGKKFERFARDEIFRFLLPLGFERIGRWWHKGEEIDIVAVNDKKKLIAFFEIKWGKLSYRETERLLNALRDKAKRVGLGWHVKGEEKERQEYYGIIAESIEGKEELSNQGFMVYDLGNLLNKNIKRNKRG